MANSEKMGRLAVFAGIMVFVGIFFIPFNYVEGKTDQSTCKQMYERYAELKEQKFREKYSSKSFVNDCIKLYKNPNWYFAGKNKIDSNYANLELQMKNTVTKKVDVKILSHVPIGADKFLIKFRACVDGSSIQQPSFLIKSKMDQYMTTTSKVLQKGKCVDYNATIKAKQSSDINVEYVSDISKYPDVKLGPLRI